MLKKTNIYLINNLSKSLFSSFLIEKIFSINKINIFILTNSLEATIYMDKILWSYNGTSFMPHAIYSKKNNIFEKYNILIGNNKDSIPKKTNLVINISNNFITKDFFNKSINTICEIIENKSDGILNSESDDIISNYSDENVLINKFNITKVKNEINIREIND